MPGPAEPEKHKVSALTGLVRASVARGIMRALVLSAKHEVSSLKFPLLVEEQQKQVWLQEQQKHPGPVPPGFLLFQAWKACFFAA